MRVFDRNSVRGVEIRKSFACLRASYPKKVTCPHRILLVLFFVCFFFENIWCLQAQMMIQECQGVHILQELPLDQWQESVQPSDIFEINQAFFLWPITSLRKTSDKVLIKLTQTSLHKYCCPNEDHFAFPEFSPMHSHENTYIIKNRWYLKCKWKYSIYICMEG